MPRNKKMERKKIRGKISSLNLEIGNLRRMAAYWGSDFAVYAPERAIKCRDERIQLEHKREQLSMKLKSLPS